MAERRTNLEMGTGAEVVDRWQEVSRIATWATRVRPIEW
jgi:hypothetical protein